LVSVNRLALSSIYIQVDFGNFWAAKGALTDTNYNRHAMRTITCRELRVEFVQAGQWAIEETLRNTAVQPTEIHIITTDDIIWQIPAVFGF
jgi:hypothetical protein